MTLTHTVDTGLREFFTKRVGPEAIVDPELAKVVVSLIEGQWLDISTAPRDGTPVIIATESGKVFRGRWFGGATWSVDGYSVGFETSDVVWWMPLPTPPAKAIRGKA